MPRVKTVVCQILARRFAPTHGIFLIFSQFERGIISLSISYKNPLCFLNIFGCIFGSKMKQNFNASWGREIGKYGMAYRGQLESGSSRAFYETGYKCIQMMGTNREGYENTTAKYHEIFRMTRSEKTVNKSKSAFFQTHNYSTKFFIFQNINDLMIKRKTDLSFMILFMKIGYLSMYQRTLWTCQKTCEISDSRIV